ncbi:hypothetical protein BBP40_011713 [Aspergillus hancockii]|nr:hypothetical protein BBP40_011713 [Aspergillus hancockii]
MFLLRHSDSESGDNSEEIYSEESDHSDMEDTANNNTSDQKAEPPDKKGRTTWTKERPDNLTPLAETTESGQYALLVRNVKRYDGIKNLSVHSIVVQSEALKTFLGKALEGYPGLTMTLQRVEFKPPFSPFVHRWEAFSKARDEVTDLSEKAVVDLLYNVLEEELRETIARKTDLILNGVVTHDLLWAIFEPGSLIYSVHDEPQDKDVVRETLIARGKLWEEHKGYHYKHYEGIGLTSFMGQQVKLNVNSRIIIDAEAFNTFNPNRSISVDGRTDKLTDTKNLDKKWLDFYLEGVRDIVWNSLAFDSLVLPAKQHRLKGMILAIAKAQSKQLDAFDDVVQGKGRGIIMQLSGPPGVGKTLTAESVAEVMRVPLYILSAGDLGTTASKVENALKDILRMVPKWGAVLLLDEADVFMEARNSADLARNKLVSIFLRLLEYYEGILFLTTNRAESIDPAFESRIHVSLRYPDLDTKSRRHIWAQFLNGNEGFLPEHLDQLAEAQLNGRQIKNVLKTAHLLSREEGNELQYDHQRRRDIKKKS